MFDKDRTGHINVEEFEKLYTYVNQWLAVFKTYDTDQSGSIEEKELSNGKYSTSKTVYLLSALFSVKYSGSIMDSTFDILYGIPALMS